MFISNLVDFFDFFPQMEPESPNEVFNRAAENQCIRQQWVKRVFATVTMTLSIVLGTLLSCCTNDRAMAADLLLTAVITLVACFTVANYAKESTVSKLSVWVTLSLSVVSFRSISPRREVKFPKVLQLFPGSSTVSFSASRSTWFTEAAFSPVALSFSAPQESLFS